MSVRQITCKLGRLRVASSSAGLPVFVSASGACSLTPLRADEEQGLGEIESLIAVKVSRLSPATVYFDTQGTCMIAAEAAGTAEYEAAEGASQSFAVAKDPFEQIAFVSPAPDPGLAAGTYSPKLRSSAGIPVYGLSTTPAVCADKTGDGSFSLLSAGVCTIAVRQRGVPASEPAEAEQSFNVIRSPQEVTVAAPPPSVADAGGNYAAVFTASSGRPVLVRARGACSLTKPRENLDETLRRSEPAEDPSLAERSPAVVYFIAAGSCTVESGEVGGNAEYEPARAVKQVFQIARDPTERISFISKPPRRAHVGTRYDPTVLSSAGIGVEFSTATPSVCRIASSPVRSVHLLAVGTCTVAVRQKGVPRARPPEAEQSFRIVAAR